MKIINITTKEVICDLCGENFTHSTETGGILFNSNAVCPHCLPRFEKLIVECKEEHFIKDRAVEGETFSDFVKRIRYCGTNVLN